MQLLEVGQFVPVARPTLKVRDEHTPADVHSRAVAFLSSHLRPAAGPGSFVDSKAKSRVLESAILLHILSKHELERDWQLRLRIYLENNIQAADPFSRLIASAVLGRTADASVAETLAQVMSNLQYGQRRKYALLKMLLVEVGMLPFSHADVSPEHFAEQATHRFSKLYRSALEMLYARHAGVGANPDDLDFLLGSQARNGSWEQQSLITLTAMLSMSAHDAFRRGLDFLKSISRPDGGIPFCDNQNVWLTALTGLALQAGHASRDLLHPIADYLVSQQHENGGWSFTEDVVQTDTDDAANCLQVLLQLDPARYAGQIDRCLQFFSSLQHDDGGYPTYERVGEAEVTMTANVMLAKSLCVHLRPDLVPSIRRSADFLVERQLRDGRFEKSWSLCETYSIFRVLWALDTCEHVLQPNERLTNVRVRALHYLLESQHSDGGWGQSHFLPSDALSTAYALASIALIRPTRQVDPARASSAMRFLASQQTSTGEIVSIPDVAGPRPIIFDVPLLSTAFAVMAMGLSGAGAAGPPDLRP